MDIVKEFFDIKKDYLLKYSMILSESFSIDKKDTYLKKFIDTYVNAYYLEEYGTIEFKPYYEIKTSDITEELKGKFFEIIYEKEKKDNKIIDFKKDMSILYIIAVTAVNIDLQKYKVGSDLEYYEEKLRKIVDSKKDIINLSKKGFKELCRLVKKYEDLKNKFLDSLNNPSFKLKYEEYSGHEGKYHIKLKAYLKELNTYKRIVLSKVFESKTVYREKLKLEMNMLNEIILHNILDRAATDYYFIDLSINNINKFILGDIEKYINNNITRKHIVFLVDYSNYAAKRSSIKPLKRYNFACLLDVSRIKDVSTKLDNFILERTFDYIILDKIRPDSKKQLKDYAIEGKEIMYNKYKVNTKEV